MLPLYLYQARTSLLARIALTADGVRCEVPRVDASSAPQVDVLLRAELPAALNMATVLDARPTDAPLEARSRAACHCIIVVQSLSSHADEHAPPIERYRLIAMPALQACAPPLQPIRHARQLLSQLVLNSGSHRGRAVGQVAQVLVTHMERLVLPVLRVRGLRGAMPLTPRRSTWRAR